MDDGWTPLDLYGPSVKAWRHAATGRFRLEVAGARLEFGGENAEALEALLLALADAKRALTGEDFVPAKTVAPPRAAPGEAVVRFEPEDLDYLLARVRVGKEDSLDAAVGRAVKAYMRDLLMRSDALQPDAEPQPRPRPSPTQRTLTGPEPASVTGIGAIQRGLLALAHRRGHITRLDVGRAYGITASRRNAASARVKAESAVNALVARGLLRHEVRGPDTVWVLTETGRTLVETDLQP